jgi:hypothetical protein
MAQSPIVNALIEKRSAIGGIIADLEERTRQARADLAHIDATLRIFDPSAEPTAIKDKRPYQRSGVFASGEISRRIRDMLRVAQEPLSAETFVRHAMTDKGMEPEDKTARQTLIRAFLWRLHRMHLAGAVTKIGHGIGVRWTLPKG